MTSIRKTEWKIYQHVNSASFCVDLEGVGWLAFLCSDSQYFYSFSIESTYYFYNQRKLKYK